MMKYPNRVLAAITAGWAAYMVLVLTSWSQFEDMPYKYRHPFDETPRFTHDVKQREDFNMKFVKMLKHIGLSLVLASGLLLNVAHAQSVTPSIPPYKLGIDYRRNPSPNVEPPGTYIMSYSVTASTVISLTSPISGTIVAKYTLSPVTDSSGNLCLFIMRNNGAGTIPNTTGQTVTNGSAWEKNRTSGWLYAVASDATARWVGLYNRSATTCDFTVTWESMISQGDS